MSKAGVVKAYQYLELEYGSVGGKVTGHGPRVYGAMRLAKAGYEIWRVQIFGRWGSAAVLRCLRDAPVGLDIGIAQRCASTQDLAAIRREAADLQKHSKATELQLQEAVKEALEEITQRAEAEV